MKTMIEGYEIFPGEHCGSTSMRGLLNHYCGLQLPEPALFGLGSGVECAYLREGPMDPPVAIFGRTATLEVDLASALGIDYREQAEDDDERAWQVVRQEVLEGRPTMLTGDILYLDYREYKVHFPAHRFVLLGFDDEIEKAFIADRVRDVPEACSYGALAESRNPPEGMSTHNLWGRFHSTEVTRDLVEAIRIAIERAAKRMLGETGESGFGDFGGGGMKVSVGLEGIRELAGEITALGDRPDAVAIAGFNASCIEKFGNGGGNFRRLYAGFLDWARGLDPETVPEDAAALATRAADGWTAISDCLYAASREGADREPWKQAAVHAADVAETEQRLFEGLAERLR